MNLPSDSACSLSFVQYFFKINDSCLFVTAGCFLCTGNEEMHSGDDSGKREELFGSSEENFRGFY